MAISKLTFPVLYFPLPQDAVLGLLVGTSVQVVDKDRRRVRNNIESHLQRQYKKYDDFPDADLEDIRMRITQVTVRPTVRTEAGAFPAQQQIRVPVVSITGRDYRDRLVCQLPLLKEQFYYYDKRQLPALLKHFAAQLLNRMSPEEIHQLSLMDKPELDEVTLKVHTNRPSSWAFSGYSNRYDTLERLAERYPFPKNVQRSMSMVPAAAWEMEDHVDQVVDRLMIQRANLLIVGAPGVGKSAVLQHAIRRIHAQSRREQLNYTFWRINSQRITASTKYLGEWEEQVESLIDELKSANGTLWVEDIIQLARSGGTGPEDSVAAFIQPFIERGELQLVGEITPTQLESLRRILPGFAENFQIEVIEELEDEKVIRIFQQFADFAQQRRKIQFTRDALDRSFRLLKRYFPYERFPGKGIKFLGQCLNEAQVNQRKKITTRQVLDLFIQQTGLPEIFLRDDLQLDPQELETYFSQRIIGQQTAIEQVCNIVKIYKAGLNNPHKPITTLLFTGPTGVGKTATAKAIADYFFGMGQRKSPLIRIDMSEFQSPIQVRRLVGDGQEVGQLVKEVRERPFSVLLLDEVEKADPGIFDALLTVLDEGILTDSFGRETNFRNTIIIMTSNLGAAGRKSIGFGGGATQSQQYRAAIEAFFRPEFVNRIDTIVQFAPLDKTSIKRIAHKELEEMAHREGIEKRGIQLEYDDSLIGMLVEKGFDERFGARPLQRLLDDVVINGLSRWLLTQKKMERKRLQLGWSDSEGLQVQILK
jgi:ATP-dependent Clp protease ATP-binding subunit ClpC